MKAGRVVAAHGRRFLIEAGDDVVECVTRGRKSDIVCGDLVDFAMTDADKGVIEKVAARKNLLYRSDEFRSKLIAANLGNNLFPEDEANLGAYLNKTYYKFK